MICSIESKLMSSILGWRQKFAGAHTIVDRAIADVLILELSQDLNANF
jgi:hypothetical protein